MSRKIKGRPSDRQLDLFVAYLSDVPLKDQRDLMERPFFSLAKRPRLEPIEYKTQDVWVRVTANRTHGMATIWDADILIWAASQINECVEQGLQHARQIQFHPYDLLKSIKRGTSGRDYEELRGALNRLKGTMIETNIRTVGKRKLATFGWIEAWHEVIDVGTGHSKGMTIILPEWFYQGVLDQKLLLTISPRYFDISSGLARWLYRVARKHAGKQSAGWALSMKILHAKSGSTQRPSDFALAIRRIVQANDLPEYHLVIYRGARREEIVHMTRRSLLARDHPAYAVNLLADAPRRRTLPAQ